MKLPFLMISAGLALTVMAHKEAEGITAQVPPKQAEGITAQIYSSTSRMKGAPHSADNTLSQATEAVKDIYASKDVPARFDTMTNVIWLSRAIHFEARGEDEIGWNAVADVIVWRAIIPNYPDTIKSVLSQDNQFGWYAYKDKRTFPFHKIDPAIVKFAKRFLKNEFGLLPPALANTFFEGCLKTNSWWRNALTSGRLIGHVKIGNQHFATSKEDQAFMIAMSDL
jgi:hypothetical protein